MARRGANYAKPIGYTAFAQQQAAHFSLVLFDMPMSTHSVSVCLRALIALVVRRIPQNFDSKFLVHQNHCHNEYIKHNEKNIALAVSLPLVRSHFVS